MANKDGSYNITLETYKENSPISFMKGDEQMDSVIINFDTEAWYNPDYLIINR